MGRTVFVGDMSEVQREAAMAQEAPVLSENCPTEMQANGGRLTADARETRNIEPLKIRESGPSYNPGRSSTRLPVLRLVGADEACLSDGVQLLPLIGRVAAGARVLDPDNAEERLSVEVGRLSTAEHYLVRVQGDSMSGDDIRHDDVLVVR